MSWINNLPKKLSSSLNLLLDNTNKHEEIYLSAENASVAQLWVANAFMYNKIQELDQLVKAQRKALKEMDKEVAVDKHLDRDLEESLKRY